MAAEHSLSDQSVIHPQAANSDRWARFKGHNLEQQNQAALMSRVDTKYLLRRETLDELIQELASHYSILEREEMRQFGYETLYFDTPDQSLYLAHHNGRRRRSKLRTRHYCQDGTTWLEVKQKAVTGVTCKERMPLQDGVTSTGDILDFLTQYMGHSVAGMRPFLLVNYNRSTLLCTGQKERVTFDSELVFGTPGQERKIGFPGLVLIEVKKEHADASSVIEQKLRCRGLRPISVSKYCLGTALLYGHQIKTNNFKPALTRLRQFATDLPIIERKPPARATESSAGSTDYLPIHEAVPPIRRTDCPNFADFATAPDSVQSAGNRRLRYQSNNPPNGNQSALLACNDLHSANNFHSAKNNKETPWNQQLISIFASA